MRESVHGSISHRLSFLTFITMTNDPFARKRKVAPAEKPFYLLPPMMGPN
jgi:hypothetical protein